MANKIMKVPIGIPALDDKFSGIYAGHVTFLTGASGEGREVAVNAALNNYYRLEEHVLAVFSESDGHAALRAREVGYDLEKAVEIGALSILYHAHKPGEELPVRESLEEIIAEARRISANVLFIQDARPWLEVHPVSAAPERVEEFIATLEESGLTTIVALPEPVSAAAKKVWEKMRDKSSVAIQFRRARLGNYSMKVLTYMGLTANVHLPYETPLKFVPREGFVKDVEPEAVPTSPGEFQIPAEREKAPAAAESFSHGADPVAMDMTQSILGQISHRVPSPKPSLAPVPERGDSAKNSFPASGTETRKRTKYSFAAAMKEEW